MTCKKQKKLEKSSLKVTTLGDFVLNKLTLKKDLNKKASFMAKEYLSYKVFERFESCGDFMSHLTNADLSIKKVHKSNLCGNRFCPICTWNKAKKDAIKISIILKAIKERENQEFILLTLSAPNVKGVQLKDEIDRFNNAYKKMFARKKVKNVVNGYIRKLEVTYNSQRFITKDMYKGTYKDYFDKRNLKIGDNNPNYDTYNPHFHVILCVNKSYFNQTREYISRDGWLEIWKDAMQSNSITQLDIRKIRQTINGHIGGVLEVAKYSAKSQDLYHSKEVFGVFYEGLKHRQLITFNGYFKKYLTEYNAGELDDLKEKDENEYTHLLESFWKKSKYENFLRKLSVDEFKEFNALAKTIDEDDSVN